MDERVVLTVVGALWKRAETTVGELARAAGIGETGVREVLEELRRRKCLIEISPGGVRFVGAGLPVWRDVVESVARENRWRIGRRAVVLAKTGSTNDVAWEHAWADDADGLLVCADEQTAGRGRFGHGWCAKAEQSVLMSVLLKVPSGVEELTLLAGLATAVAVEKVLGVGAEIKWPNDILLGGKKIAGILVERRRNFCVLGIGVNVGQSVADFPAELRECATSIYMRSGAAVDRLRVLMVVVEALENWAALPRDAAEWLPEWKSRCAMLGRRVVAQSEGRRVEGQVIDVDPLQGLILRDDAGVTRILPAQSTTLSL